MTLRWSDLVWSGPVLSAGPARKFKRNSPRVRTGVPYLLQIRISNGTGFSCPAGQRDRCPLIVPGQRRQRDKDYFLSRDKGTTGQAQTLATGRDGPGFFEAVLSRPGTSRGTKSPSILPINAVFRIKINTYIFHRYDIWILGRDQIKTKCPQ